MAISSNEAIIIMPPKYVGFDNILPLACNLQNRGWQVTCLFTSLDDYKTLGHVPENLAALQASAKIIIFSFKGVDLSLLGICYLFLVLFCRRGKRVFFVNSYLGKLEWFRGIRTIYRWISEKRKYTYNLPPITGPVPINYYHEYFIAALNNPQLRRSLGKPAGEFVPYQSKPIIGRQVGYHDYDGERLRIFGFPRPEIFIGYPKCDDSWQRFVSQNMKSAREEIEESDRLVVIFPKKPARYFYDEPQTALDLLVESVAEVRRAFGDILIVVKPKPFKNAASNDWLELGLHKFADDKVVLDYTPGPILATKAILGIFNSPTSAYFDFLLKDVPCIEHARYGKMFFEIHPNGSYLRRVGVKVSETPEELRLLVSKIKDGSGENQIPHEIVCASTIRTMNGYDSL